MTSKSNIPGYIHYHAPEEISARASIAIYKYSLIKVSPVLFFTAGDTLCGGGISTKDKIYLKEEMSCEMRTKNNTIVHAKTTK